LRIPLVLGGFFVKAFGRKASLAGVLALVASLGFAIPAHANADCGTVLKSSIKLTHDIGPCTGDGLIAGANKITIDLNGHTISGDGDYENTPQAGIKIPGRTTVKVIDSTGTRNGTVKLFNAGVLIDGGSTNTVSGITASDNKACNSDDFLSTGFAPDACNASNMGDGILVNGSTKNTISKNTVTRNANFNVASGGISMTNFSTQNTVDANTVTGNFNTGVRAEAPNSMRNVISNNTISANRGCGRFGASSFCGGNGISISFGAAQSQVFNNTIKDHISGTGVFTSFDSDRSTIRDNTLTGNATGIGLGASQTEVLNNTVSSNTVNGISVPGGSIFRSDDGAQDFIRRHNLVQGNTVQSNGRNGIIVLCPRDFVDPAKLNTCLTGDVTYVDESGRPISNSGQNEILDNRVTGNGGAGAGTELKAGGLVVGRYDLLDQHPTCDRNEWVGNTYDTARPDCTKG
jgi:parallel beta-helix repeat protein